MPTQNQNHRKIEKALQEKGYTFFEALWEPIGKGPEMCGPSGGWSVIYNDDGDVLVDHIFGYNIAEVMEQIAKLPFAVRKESAGMIEWKEYDPTSREIESHRDHLITNGHRILIAQHASIPGTGKYSWMINNSLIDWVTHYAKINMPAR